MYTNIKLITIYQFVGTVSVVITGLGPDYTKMESFGKVEEFADTLVSLYD